MLLVLLVAGGFYCIREGWIGYMPPLDELQSPISKYASQIITSDGKVIGTWSRKTASLLITIVSPPTSFKPLWPQKTSVSMNILASMSVPWDVPL